MKSSLCPTVLTALIACVSPLHHALAQSYPTKPIRLVVTYPAGGGGDNVVRPLAQKLTDTLGATIIVDNRPGGGGLIGANLVAKASTDGYTLLVGTVGTHATSPQLYSRVPFDALKDFQPITLVATSPTLLAVSNKLGIKTVKELVDAAKASPGKLSYASGGAGSPPHLATEIFNSIAGINLLHVPYKGGGESVPALVAGEIDVHFFGIATAMPYARTERFKVIAIAHESRWPDLPNVPTFAESGWPQYQNANWYGLSAPANTPKAIIDRLNQAVLKALASGDYRERLRLIGAIPVGSSPQEFATFIRAEYERYGKVIKALGLRVD